MPIVSFKDERARLLLLGRHPGKGFPADIVRVAQRKVRQLNGADRPSRMREPAGNRFEALTGDRAGQYSFRINDQFRLCFRWTPEGAADVEFVNYH